jgi:hypothetical protein
MRSSKSLTNILKSLLEQHVLEIRVVLEVRQLPLPHHVVTAHDHVAHLVLVAFAPACALALHHGVATLLAGHAAGRLRSLLRSLHFYFLFIIDTF